MLRDLLIENLAIIEAVRIRFGPGLNILTGETGAGKSLLVQALELVLGERARSEWIGSGAEEARVEAVIDTRDAQEIEEILREAGLPVSETLVVRRTVTRSGRNRIYVNDRPATLALLEKLGHRLADIHGQHEHQSLLRVGKHMEVVDRFGGLLPARKRAGDLYRSLRELQQELSLRKAEQERMAAERELALFQQEEISRARLREGEEEELEQERGRLLHVERLLEVCAEAGLRLYSGPQCVVDILGDLERRIQEMRELDETLSRPLELLETARHYVEEAGLNLERYASGLERDPVRLQQVEERLALIRELQRKYHRSIGELLELESELASKIQRMDNYEEDCLALEEEIHRKERSLLQEARSLSDARKEVARRLEEEVEKELLGVGMRETAFRVDVRPIPREATNKSGGGIWIDGQRIDPSGMDQVEFLIRPNPGQPFRPLQRIASGGELSRIMLAVRNVLRRSDRVPILVFDEVDAGIGGAVAEAVGARLRQLSRDFQILCITHLPQIAVFGDTHLKVSKRIEGGRTLFQIQPLGASEREREIARMLGGMKITKKTLAHAREMLQQTATPEAR